MSIEAGMEEIEIGGETHCLRHLAPIRVVAVGKGKEGSDLTVEVFFSRHVFSESCEWDDRDLVDENGKPRSFSQERYDFSLGLPALASAMIEESYLCWESRDRNRAMNYSVVDATPGEVLKIQPGRRFVVYFYLYPGSADGVDVKLTVISCHERDFKLDKSERRYSMHVLLRTCLFQQKRMP